MDYLALCQRVVQEAGIAGGGPSSVENQNGQLAKVTGWVAQAWVEIQLMRPSWLFMHAEFTFNTDAATRDYLAADKSITDMKLWETGSFLIYNPVIGESDQNILRYLDYNDWRARYRNRMNDRKDERPVLFTILPTNEVRFEPRPDKEYTIDGDYKRSTQNFAVNDDVPTNLPDDFHMIIVWQALKYYGFYEDAPDVLDEAETNFDNLLHRLEIEQLPAFSEDFPSLA